MSKKIDERLPQDIGKDSLPGYTNLESMTAPGETPAVDGIYPSYVAVRTPWDKLVSYKEAMHYISRYNSVVSAAVMQAYRLLIRDYRERSTILCEDAYARLTASDTAAGETSLNDLNIHPFCRGAFVGGLCGDSGDETLHMCGRVNDFGTYRVEKELDICDWDIVGTELCRATTKSLQANSDVRAGMLRKGPTMEYCMVEAKGAGDRHCRIVAESREKYPVPEHEIWESFGPIVTADQIRYTEEKDCLKESMVFRKEANFRFDSGTHKVNLSPSISMNQFCCAATFYLLPGIEEAIKRGRITEEDVNYTLKCVMEAAGKTAWGDAVAKKAHRMWLGVPDEIDDNDGRIMGGHIELYLSAMGVDYIVEAFNKDEVILNLNRYRLGLGYNKFVDCLVSYWYGMTKTLISPQWSLWEEPGDTTPDRCRIKIAKKIDKFC